ncbi:YjcZ family sporulation protein [Halobacillus sp. Marseille-P3879]|nr:YjcZ family sporulation protein [Halobacillus sp. Marseille-P3879]
MYENSPYANSPYGGGYGGYGRRCPRPGSSFALIVVLFILLIIVGAAFYC